jgi:D-alanine transaminase
MKPNNETMASWNGVIQPLSQVQVPVLDRGFLFGDGVYEGLRLYSKKIFLLQEHMDRLENSLKGTSIDWEVAGVQKRISQLVAHSQVENGFVYVQITRGADKGRSHFPTTKLTPNELIFIQAYSDDHLKQEQSRGITITLQPDRRHKLCDFKTINLLANILAKQVAMESGTHEALLFDEEGFVTEGTQSSFYGVQAGSLVTTVQSEHILPGITRDYIVKIAAELGIPVVWKRVRASELPSIDELFVCGSGSEVLPVIAVDGSPIGSGIPGPITKKIQGAFAAKTAQLTRESFDHK